MAGDVLGNHELVHLSKLDHVAVITLNRPKALNSLNSELCKNLHNIIDDLERDDEVRVMVITGAGDKAFCTGIDLRERKGMNTIVITAAPIRYLEGLLTANHLSTDGSDIGIEAIRRYPV